MAFQEVCPERIDLVHKHYRNLCSLLVDVDEWGQIAILSMLTRYARTQFMDPNKYVRYLIAHMCRVATSWKSPEFFLLSVSLNLVHKS